MHYNSLTAQRDCLSWLRFHDWVQQNVPPSLLWVCTCPCELYTSIHGSTGLRDFEQANKQTNKQQDRLTNRARNTQEQRKSNASSKHFPDHCRVSSQAFQADSSPCLCRSVGYHESRPSGILLKYHGVPKLPDTKPPPRSRPNKPPKLLLKPLRNLVSR